MPSPLAPSPSWRGSALTREALERGAALRVELRHPAGEVAERDVAELVDQLLHLGLRAQVGVGLARVDGAVEVGLALAPAGEQALRVQPGERGHIRRIRARRRS